MLDQTEPILDDEVAIANGHQSRYVVHLPVFEGPLDLLLHLIEKRQMEITTISLVAVTDQYLAYLQHWQEPGSMPLANMAAFISIATRLLYIKSQSLLPHASKEEMTGGMEDAAGLAEELRTHLLEYKFAKEIAHYLRVREDTGLQTYGRSGLLAGIEAQLTWTPPTLLGMEVESLAHAFQRLLELRATRDEANGAAFIPLARVRVSERIAEIVALLRVHPSIQLAELIANELSRIVIIVTFLAVLELWKRGRVRVQQAALFDPITLERGEHWVDDGQVDDEEIEFDA